MKKIISRREMIKVLIAGSGSATALAFLPAEWMKPVIESGVLPAHAQTSIPPTETPILPTETPTGTVTP